SSPEVNTDAVKLEKAPKIAVYSPKEKKPWDDAVTLALTYAEIPYDVVYDSEIMDGHLKNYDWLHLHHEDFTGQMGKFYNSYRHMDWYKAEEESNKQTALKYGYTKISELKKAVVRNISDYVSAGGFMFAMCSAADTYDIALAAMKVDICDVMFDGDPMDPNAQAKLDYSNTFAFKDFQLELNPNVYEYSNIDMTEKRKVNERDDYFLLFEFSAKWDPVPTMLCQDHENMIKGFMGQTTAFNRNLIKSNVLVMGENKVSGEARYIHGEYGKGTWTFFSGHDPEDYQHFVGDPVTDLDLHKQSAGYRLILNNVLFPAARKKQHKT
ncbi:MAG: asparagine synthetase B, partial [Odoribacter sp.]